MVVNGFTVGSDNRVDRTLQLLESGSDADRTNVLRNGNAVGWEVILEQSILQKKDAALSALVNYPKFIDWTGKNTESLLDPFRFAKTIERLLSLGSLLRIKSRYFFG
jgi:hypothetical protein